MLKAIVKDTAIYGIADFFFKLMNVATFPIFAYFFTVDQFGAYSLATTLTALLIVIFNCGMNPAVQRFFMDPETTKQQQPVIVGTGFLFLSCLTTLFGTFALLSAYQFRALIEARMQLSWVLLALAILSVLPTQIFRFCLQQIRLCFRPWQFAFLSALQSGLSISLSLFFVMVLQMGVEGYLLGGVVSFIAVAPISVWCIRKFLSWKGNWCLSKKLLCFGYPHIFSGIAAWLYASMDRWMLLEMGTKTDVGIYSTAFKIGTVLIFLNTAFQQAWSPRAMQLYRSVVDYRGIYSRVLTLWFYFLILAATGISLFAEEGLMILTTPEYWPAAKIIPYVAFGLVFCGTTLVTAFGVSLEKKTYHLSIATWLTAGLNFLLNFYLIPVWSVKGAAVATLVSYLVLTCYYLVCTQVLHPLPLETKKIICCMLLVPCSLIFVLYLQSYPWSFGLVAVKLCYLIAQLAIGVLIRIIYPMSLFSISVPLKRAS